MKQTKQRRQALLFSYPLTITVILGTLDKKKGMPGLIFGKS